MCLVFSISTFFINKIVLFMEKKNLLEIIRTKDVSEISCENEDEQK